MSRNSGGDIQNFLEFHGWKLGVDPHQSAGLAVGQRAEEYSVDYAEDRSVRADSKCHRNDRDRGESGVVHQHSQPVSQVLQLSFASFPPRDQLAKSNEPMIIMRYRWAHERSFA